MDKKKIIKRKDTPTVPAISRWPRLVKSRNVLFLDSTNSTVKSSTAEPISSTLLDPSTEPSVTDVSNSTVKSSIAEPISSTLRDPSTEPSVTDEDDKSVRSKNSPKIQKNSVGQDRKSKNFIRLRFRIDCASAVDVNVDDLVHFMRKNMKIEGRKNNLNGVTINRRNANIDIISKVILKKKYLKRLSKQYLKSRKHFKYHVLSKNSRTYQILVK